ncbi:hypothetical protein L839_0043 [Mycobacterium avium MAV_120809_2495]|nr:hypothetical protein L839_0043 [Mycobacterium avium MAV_120809_2495]
MTAVATIVGASARRSMTQRATIEDPYADEDFNTFDGDRALVVTTPDGVPLAVREAGPPDAPLTMVFVHGFCLQMGAFHFQRTRLPEQLDPTCGWSSTTSAGTADPGRPHPRATR